MYIEYTELLKNLKIGEEKLKKFSLGLDASINGIYLNSETIELLSIIQCKSIEELQDFARNCSQLNVSEENIDSWNDQNIEDIKRSLFEKYKETLIPLKQSIEDRRSVKCITRIYKAIYRFYCRV